MKSALTKMANPQEGPKTYKIVVLGDGGVGKSCLTWRFIHDQFLEKYDPTIDDAYRKDNFHVDGELCPLEICDTAGQDQFAATRDLYYKTGDGFLLCYSLVDEKTVDAVTERFNAMKFAKVGRRLLLCDPRNRISLPSSTRDSRNLTPTMLTRWVFPEYSRFPR